MYEYEYKKKKKSITKQNVTTLNGKNKTFIKRTTQHKEYQRETE